jgi:hypothetical protein
MTPIAFDPNEPEMNCQACEPGGPRPLFVRQMPPPAAPTNSVQSSGRQGWRMASAVVRPAAV